MKRMKTIAFIVVISGAFIFLYPRGIEAQASTNSDYYEVIKRVYSLVAPYTGEIDRHLKQIDGLLGRLDEKTLSKVRQDVIAFLTTGCRGTYYEDYCMFLPNRSKLREDFFELFKKYKCHPETQLIDEILASGNDIDFRIYENENFITYSKRFRDASPRLQEEIVSQMEKLPSSKIEYYFKLFGYGVELFGRDAMLPHFRNKYLTGPIEAHRIREICDGMSLLSDRIRCEIQAAILTELSNYVYTLPVEKWLEIGNEIMIDFVRYSLYSKKNYIEKVVKDMTARWDKSLEVGGQEILLLTLFLHKERHAEYREIYRELEPYFGNNAGRFICLHGGGNRSDYGQPDLISFLNENKDNLGRSIDILIRFCRNPGERSVELYTLVKAKYYPESPDRIFVELFRPVYRDSRSDNRVRRLFLSDTYHGEFLLKPHGLEVARHFLNIDLNETLMIEFPDSYSPEGVQKIRNIQFVTRVYLDYYDVDNSGRKETLNYVNVILLELTGKIAGLLFNFEDYELMFGELRKILSKLEAIHRRFAGIDYREMRALMEIYNKIKDELRKTLKNNRLTPGEKRSKLVNIIGLTIKIAGVLRDKLELNYIVKKLCIDIFGVGFQGNECKRIPLSESQLQNRTDNFISLDRDLRNAAFAVEDNRDFLAALYSDFYIPLIRIQGFLDRIYEYNPGGSSFQKERPYESLFNELEPDDRKTSFDTLDTILKCGENLNIEESLKLLLASHYKMLGVNLWEEPERYQFNENTNPWVFHYLLEKMLKEYGLREEYQYRVLMDKFFENFETAANIPPGRYQELHVVYRFIVFRLLNPYELKAFPLYDENGEIEFHQLTGKTNEISVSSEIVRRDKIDGQYRFRLIQSMQRYLNTSDMEDLKLQVDTALLLPNSQENNAGYPDVLSNYFAVKRRLFQMMDNRLSSESQLKVDFLILLLKLEKSCRGESLGFARVKLRLKDRLSHQDRATLALEEMRLDLLEKGPITLQGFENYFANLEILIQRLRDIYDIGPFDPVEYALRKMFEIRGGKLNRAINLHELEQMYFIVAFFKNALRAANELAKSKDQFLSVMDAYKDVIEIYNHFLPFMYDLDLDFMTRQEHDILFLMLFDHEIKSSLIAFRERASETLSKEDFLSLKKEYENVVPYILTHNFADIELVFKTADDENLKIFEFDRIIEYHVFNFEFLFQMRETKQLNARTFIDEAFASFSSNLDFIADVNDEVVWEYYFGDFRNRLFGDLYPGDSKLEIKCVDDAIRKMVKLSLRSQLPEKIRKPIETVIQDPVGVFTEGFKNLETAVGMQKMWEEIVKKLGEMMAERNNEPDFYDKYQEFYSNAVFQQGKPSFRQDIAHSYVKKFTKENDLEQQRQALFPVLESLKQAIETYGNNSSFRYFNAHRQAVVNLMRNTVLGIKLPRKVPYIAKAIYDNQVGEIGAVKAVSETVWQDSSLFDLYDWIYDGKKNYESIDDLRGLFLGTNSLNSYFVQSVHMYVEEQEQVYVERLGELNGNTERRLNTLNSVSQSLTAFQRGDENEILRTYGLLVDLRRGHNKRVENRTRQKIETLQASDNQKKDIKDFYYLLKIDEGDVEQYAQEWRYILCVLIPFSKYLGQSTLTLNSVLGLLDNRDIFKFYFFYFYRTYNNRGLTLNKYMESYPGGNAGRVERFFGSELGFDYFSEMYDNGTSRSYMNDRYTFKQIRNPTRQQNHIMVRRFQAHCSFSGTGSRSFKQFYRNKLGIFYEVLNEINLVVSHGPKRYLQLLYYVTHTFPYIAAFQVGQSSELNFLSRYPGDRQSSESPTPFNRLIEIWNNAPARYRCLETLDATIGSIFLLQARSVDLNRRDYIEAVAGSLDFFQQYEYIRIQLTRQRCLE